MSQHKIKKRTVQGANSPLTPKADPTHAIFIQAESYYQAAHVLFVHACQNIGHHPQLFFPMTVCQAFSLELFMKALLTQEGKPSVFGHDLEKLFSEFSTESKAYVKAYSQPGIIEMQRAMMLMMQHHQKTTGQTETMPTCDFEYMLASSSKAFEAFRYVHEASPQNPNPGLNWVAKPILHAVRERIIALRPDLKNVRFTHAQATPSTASAPSPQQATPPAL
jgi:hypothetical protein